MANERIYLEELLGAHVLTGVAEDGTYGTKHANTLDFILDGRILSAIEDEDDGYRSMLDEIIENRPGVIISNRFSPCHLIGKWKDTEEDIVELSDIVTGRVVLSIGTDRYDSYYPCFEARFNPEAMAVNQAR